MNPECCSAVPAESPLLETNVTRLSQPSVSRLRQTSNNSVAGWQLVRFLLRVLQQPIEDSVDKPWAVLVAVTFRQHD